MIQSKIGELVDQACNPDNDRPPNEVISELISTVNSQEET